MCSLTQLPLAKTFNSYSSIHRHTWAETDINVVGVILLTERKYRADSEHSGFWVIAGEIENKYVRKKLLQIDAAEEETKTTLNLQTITEVLL